MTKARDLANLASQATTTPTTTSMNTAIAAAVSDTDTKDFMDSL